MANTKTITDKDERKKVKRAARKKLHRRLLAQAPAEKTRPRSRRHRAVSPSGSPAKH